MKTGDTRPNRRPWRTLIFAVLAGLIIYVASIAEPLEIAMKVARNKLGDHQASGATVLVAIDDRSLADLGPAPWNDAQLAALLERVGGAGPRSVHLDAELSTEQGPAADRLEAALASLQGRLTLPARFSVDRITGQRTDHLPPARFSRHAELVNVNLTIFWDGAVWEHPYGATVADRMLPSLAARLADQPHRNGAFFPIDHGIDFTSVPVVSAGDLLNGRTAQDALMGRDIVIARTDSGVERLWAPGHGPLPPSMFQILAAETLRNGPPLDLGAMPTLMLAVLLAALILFDRRRWVAVAILAGACVGAIVGPMLLEEIRIHVMVLPALSTILIAGAARLIASLRRSYHERGTTNLVTGLPNLEALRHVPLPDGAIVVVARIKNYPQITATLEPRHEKEMVEQIVARLNFGTGASRIYQSDEGVFVWIPQERAEDVATQQLEALHALFRSPIVVATRLIDLAVTFGLDLSSDRPLLQRVPSALIAADGAAREGKRWASFNPASLDDAEWAMSLLARLDRAIDAEELWVAYQPKVDCATGEVTGAEALVRWTHPEKGQVYPDQFIGAAEEGGRIERLTHFVLDRALRDAARINAEGRRFGIAVNLSALLLSQHDLVDWVAALLRKHEMPAELLTLEVTETSTIGTGQEALTNLEKLAALGVALSIDDYGTGFSTLEYLKRIPAGELKIDRSFISMLDKSQSDRIMVNSTIQLAHSLGRRVVAEGVENEEVMAELRRMRCDLAQGYHLGRPMPIAQLRTTLDVPERARAAA